MKRARLRSLLELAQLAALLWLVIAGSVAHFSAEHDPKVQLAGFWFVFLLNFALFIVGQILAPKPDLENARPAGLGDFNFPTATEGRVIPILWGTCLLEGPNVVWYGDLRQEAITKEIKTGLFSSEDQVIGFQYKVGIQFGLALGVVDSLKRILIGDEEVFSGTVTHGQTVTINEPNLFGGDELGNGGVVGTLRFFSGTGDQTPSTYLGSASVTAVAVSNGGSGHAVNDLLTVSGGTFTSQAKAKVTQIVVGPGTVVAVELQTGGLYTVAPSSPAATTSSGAGTGCTLTITMGGKFQAAPSGKTSAYRELCYLAPDVDPIYVGNSTSIKPWKFELRRIVTGPVAGAHEVVNGADCNPANVIYELLTQPSWGIRRAASEIDSADFAAAGATLFAEGNGWSMILDRPREAEEIIDEISRQIDGVVYFDQLAGKWKIKLVRADYDINSVPQLNRNDLVELRSFARGAWSDTTNEVRVSYRDRADSYKETFALVHDMANVRIQGGRNVSATSRYGGVKDGALASKLSLRDLRALSYPLAKLSCSVDRTFYNVVPGSVIAYTDALLGLSQLPMRITSIDYGNFLDGKIGLELVQDVFAFQVGTYGASPTTLWVPPSLTLLPFLAAEQKVFESPRAIVLRDPAAGGVIADRVWTGARRRGPELGFRIVERHAVGAPSGAYVPAGDVFKLFLIGSLKNTASVGSAYPLSSLLVAPGPDLQAALEAAFLDASSPQDVGVNLIGLCLIDEEFILVTAAQTSGADVQLTGVYRGVMDSVQASHAAGASVFLLHVGGGLTDTVFVPGDTVDVKLLPLTAQSVLPDSQATAVQLTMANRVRRPYPPSLLKLNGTSWPSSASLEGTGSGPETFGILSELNRRDYRTVDEVQALTVDAATLFGDFPTVNSTTHEVDVRKDPSGTNTFLVTFSGGGTQITLLRLSILKANAGVLPTSVRAVVRAKHTVGTTIYSSRQELTFDFSATSALTGQFAFGALLANATSNLYTATVNGTYSFTLSSAFTAGAVEFRLNAGAWTSLIAAGNTTGNIAGVVATDTIEVRHTSTDTAALKELDMNAPGAGQDGFAVLYT